jgi:hypothetical protein
MLASKIKESTLRELAEANSLSGAIALGQKGGFAVTVRYESEAQRLLANARGETRMFPNLNTLANFLGKFGITRFEVDMTAHEASRVRGARPDRAAALRRTRTTPRQTPIDFPSRTL